MTDNTAVYNAWLKEQLFYPPGNIPALTATSAHDCYGDDAALMEGIIDDRPWVTRPDMIISATNLTRLKAEHGAHLELIGDTLPNALLGKPEEFMASLPQLDAKSAITNLVDQAPGSGAAVTLQLTNPNKPHYERHVRANTKWRGRVINAFNARRGKRVVICGAGPSLATDAGLLKTRPYDELWACNRALPWLFHNGYTPTHALWVDPGDAWKLEWADPPKVFYYISSSAQPELFAHLAAHKRRFRLFHNWVGIHPPTETWKCPIPEHPEWEYETWLYATQYPTTVCTGAGLNAVNRAVALALYHNFDLITVLGADCCCRTGTTRMPRGPQVIAPVENAVAPEPAPSP